MARLLRLGYLTCAIASSDLNGLPVHNDGLSLLQVSAKQHLSKITRGDGDGVPGTCNAYGDLHWGVTFPEAMKMRMGDFHNLGLSRLFQSADGYIVAHGFQCLFSTNPRPNAALTMFAVAVEGVKLIFVGDASSCYKNVQFRIEKDGEVMKSWGKTLPFNMWGGTYWDSAMHEEQTIDGTTIKYRSDKDFIYFSGGDAAAGNEWTLRTSIMGDNSQHAGGADCTNDDWKTAQPGNNKYFANSYVDFKIVMQNVDQTDQTVCGAPDQSSIRAPGTTVAIANEAAEATSIFSQADLDSRCEGCVWFPMQEIRASIRFEWPPNSGKIVAERSGKTLLTEYDDCVEWFTQPAPIAAGGYYVTGVCGNKPADCIVVDDAALLCESVRTPPSCTAHPWLAAPPPPEEECTENGCSYDRGQELCDPLKRAPQAEGDMYMDCLSDWCASCDENVVDEYEELENMLHPTPKCTDGSKCVPNHVCEESLLLSLGTLTVNNLGNAGPDPGAAQELRYSKVAFFSGIDLDLVVTTNSEYAPKNVALNGLMGTMGRINLVCGQTVDLDFHLVETGSNDEVLVDNVAISFFDMDEGPRGQGRGTLSACSAVATYISLDSELVAASGADCPHSVKSSQRGAKRNEPTSPDDVSEDQMSRSVTFAFEGVSTMHVQWALSDCRRTARNLQFAMEPTVACLGSSM